MVGDPVADFLNRIKTAALAGKEQVEIPYSKFKHALADVLEANGFLSRVEKQGKQVAKSLTVTLSKDRSVEYVARISKPSRRVYYKTSDIKPVRDGKGLLVLSTPEGILTGQDAKSKQVGGEALFKIW